MSIAPLRTETLLTDAKNQLRSETNRRKTTRVSRNCRFKDCLDFFYFFVCLLYSPLEKCSFYQSSVSNARRHKHSSRPLAHSAEALCPFASFPHTPVCPSIAVLLRLLMLESHELEFVFCQIECSLVVIGREGYFKRSEFNSRCARHV